MSANKRPIQGATCFSKNCALRFLRRREAAAGKAGHDLAQRRRVILRLEIVLGPLDAERGEILAQARQRTLVEKAGQIVGRVGQQFAAPEADEQIEIFALDYAATAMRCRLCRARRGRDPSGVASPRNRAICASNAFDGARDSSAASSAYSWARPASTSINAHQPRPARYRDRDEVAMRDTPVAASTAITRSAGTLFQFETEGWAMPIFRASSAMPPAAELHD